MANLWQSKKGTGATFTVVLAMEVCWPAGWLASAALVPLGQHIKTGWDFRFSKGVPAANLRSGACGPSRRLVILYWRSTLGHLGNGCRVGIDQKEERPPGRLLRPGGLSSFCVRRDSKLGVWVSAVGKRTQAFERENAAVMEVAE
jgi:hypothetical protein